MILPQQGELDLAKIQTRDPGQLLCEDFAPDVDLVVRIVPPAVECDSSKAKNAKRGCEPSGDSGKVCWAYREIAELKRFQMKRGKLVLEWCAIIISSADPREKSRRQLLRCVDGTIVGTPKKIQSKPCHLWRKEQELLRHWHVQLTVVGCFHNQVQLCQPGQDLGDRWLHPGWDEEGGINQTRRSWDDLNRVRAGLGGGQGRDNRREQL